MKMLLYAGVSDEDIKQQRFNATTPTLRLRVDGKEMPIQDLVGKTFKFIKNNYSSLGFIIEEVTEES